jgi:uncharacterized protein YdeI (YjbR/CyaY-like superfamily)
MMKTSGKNPGVDGFFVNAERWRDEYKKLREIIADCGLDEELKWGVPCYTLKKKNVVLMHGFKEYCALLFFKGALLNDPEGILIRQTGNVQSSRQIRFTNSKEISVKASILKAYVFEAIEVEKAGLKVGFKKTSECPVSEEFKKKLDEDPGLKKAFEALTPGRQRAYLLYFASPKQSKTRESRIEKSIPGILIGKGLNDL